MVYSGVVSVCVYGFNFSIHLETTVLFTKLKKVSASHKYLMMINSSLN